MLPAFSLRVKSFDELPRERYPIDVRRRHDMRIPISCRTAELDEDQGCFERVHLPAHPLEEDLHLLAEGRRRCGLPMRACQHRRTPVGRGERGEVPLNLPERAAKEFALKEIPHRQSV